MSHQQRKRNALAKLGLLFSFIVLIFWAASVWSVFGYNFGESDVRLRAGKVHYRGNPGRNAPKGWYRLPAGRAFTWAAVKEEFGRLILNELPEGYLTSHPELVRREAWRRLYWELGLGTPSWKIHPPDFPFYGEYLDAVIPMWMVASPIWIVSACLWLRRRRPKRGYCDVCGYCLKDNRSGVCPECGEPKGGRESEGNLLSFES